MGTGVGGSSFWGSNLAFAVFLILILLIFSIDP
jgi:hypothetical protein